VDAGRGREKEEAVRRLTVGVDLDGVCYRFIDALRMWIHLDEGVPLSRLPVPLPDGCSASWPCEQWGLSTDDFRRAWAKGVEAGFLFKWGLPEEGCREGLGALRDDGHRVVVVTARAVPGVEDLAEGLTRDWLRRHALHYDELLVNADKCCVRTDVFVEDNPGNYDALEGAGSRPYLFDQPWNRDGSDRRRVRDWPEFVGAVRREAAAIAV
jgi:uncharacterized HAD superfamily protein